MRIIEILSGVTPDGTHGFLYRHHDGITQHDYVWLEATRKKILFQTIKNATKGDYFSIEFPVKTGYSNSMWGRDNSSVIKFETVSKEDQLYFMEPIGEKFNNSIPS